MDESLYERGVKQIEQGNDDAAKSAFAEAIKRDPSADGDLKKAWLDGCIKRGVVLISEGNYDDAKTSFGKATMHDPAARKRVEEALIEAYIDRGKDLFRNGRDDEADVAFAKAPDRNSSVKKRVAEEKKHLSEELVVASIARGAELMGEGKVEEASMSFAGALKRDPKARLRVNRDWATAYNELAWKSFLELPKDMLGESLPRPRPRWIRAKGDRPRSRQSVRSRHARIDLSGDGSYRRGVGRLRQGDQKRDHGPEYIFRTRTCHEQKGNMELAVADYKRAAELPAEDDYSRLGPGPARERLAELRGQTKSSGPTIGMAPQ